MSQQYQQYPQQQQPTQPPQPPKKRHTVRNVFLVLTVLFLVGVGGCFAVIGGIGSELDKEASTVHTVVYKVTGVKGDLTYTTDGSTTTEQITDAKLPWSKTLEIKGLMSVYQIHAQNSLGQKGKIGCSISVDGKVVKSATASGLGAIASCDYTK
jgi:hypothetical protein